MQSEESQKITKRFFEVIHTLKTLRIIRGKKTFTDRYGINRWNFTTLEKSPERDLLQMAWLGYLITDFNVSAEWLMTGKGEMFKGAKPPEKQKIHRPKKNTSTKS